MDIDQKRGSLRARGAGYNPPNRFEKLEYTSEEDVAEGRERKTEFFCDPSRSIISYNDCPDVGFDASINPYRGCEHGCIYCYVRPTHEYLGWSAGLDFETRILVKLDAGHLLHRELSSPKWTPRVLALSGVTDPYQPVERKLGVTRSCLELLAEFRNPVAIITKNHLVTRDIDILRELTTYNAVCVNVSITTLDSELSRVMEPRTSHPGGRLAAIAELAAAGIPVGVMVAPVIPALNDYEMPAILRAAAQAGAKHAGYVILRLPWAVAPLFQEWLTRHFPERKDKILNRIRSLRGGRLNDPRYHYRMRGEGVFVKEIKRLFEMSRRKAGIPQDRAPLSTDAFKRPAEDQGSLFE
jgi:DNA repair photolyase